MNRVFEAFVTRLVTQALEGTGATVSPQKRIRSVIRNETTRRTYATIRPDLVIERSVRCPVPLDVKYKTYELKKVSTADIYQTFMYAYAFGTEDRRAGILFPSSGRAGHALTISPVGGQPEAWVSAVGIDVPAALDALGGDGLPLLLRDVREAIGRIVGDQLVPASV